MQEVFRALGLDDQLLTRKLISAAVILAVAWGALRLLRLLTRRIERAARDGDPARLSEAEQRGRTIAQLLRSVGWVVVGVTALLMVLNLFISIAPLIAGLGVVGLAVSFGAQGLVKDVIAGFFVLVENQFRVGDVVRIGGVEGAVEHLTLRTTVLRDGHGVVHFVPNGQITVVSNLTRHWSRAVVDVGVAYTEDVDRVMSVLRGALAEFAGDPAWRPLVLETPNVAGVQRLGESGFEIRVWVNVAPGRQAEVERELRRRFKNRLDEEGIALAVPQRIVHLTQAPAGAALPPT